MKTFEVNTIEDVREKTDPRFVETNPRKQDTLDGTEARQIDKKHVANERGKKNEKRHMSMGIALMQTVLLRTTLRMRTKQLRKWCTMGKHGAGRQLSGIGCIGVLSLERGSTGVQNV